MTEECPHAHSDMTPCYHKDGTSALTGDGCCVGCQKPQHVLDAETIPITTSVPTAAEQMAPKSFKDACYGIRADIELTKKTVWNLQQHPGKEEAPSVEAQSEILANIELSYRHLEDARMRIGKVLQAYDGGKSIYDKSKIERNQTHAKEDKR